MKTGFIILALFILTSVNCFAQYTTDKVVGKKHQSLADSLKNSEYPYILPIWGAKVVKKGFDLPYSAGLGINYLAQTSNIKIENLRVGFNHKEPLNLDGLVRFDKAISRLQSVNVRPDVWLFPFLNVYGILGVGKGSTEVGYGVWVTDSTGTDKQVFSSNTKVEFQTTTFGFGITPTMGIGGFWFAGDMNFTWSDIPQLNEPAFAFVFGPRLGKNLRFKNPSKSVSIWVGGFRLSINAGTTGSVNMSDIYSSADLDAKISNGYAKIEENQKGVDQWWSDLTPVEQKNPVNVAKYETATAASARAGQALANVENAGNKIESSSVQYSIDKSPATKWNFLIGTQFQINKHWMIRAEYGFLSQRTQFIGGLQYRFGL